MEKKILKKLVLHKDHELDKQLLKHILGGMGEQGDDYYYDDYYDEPGIGDCEAGTCNRCNDGCKKRKKQV